MGWKTSDFEVPRNAPVEQATAAPGEKRSVLGPCGKCGSLSIHVRLVETTVPGDQWHSYVPGSIRCDECGATRG